MKVSNNNNASSNRAESGGRSPCSSKKLSVGFNSVAANSTCAAENKENSCEGNNVAATVDGVSINKITKPLKIKVPVKLVIKQPLANASVSSSNPLNEAGETNKSVSKNNSSSTNDECVVKVSSSCESSSSCSGISGGSMYNSSNNITNILSKPSGNLGNNSSTAPNGTDLPQRNLSEINNQQEITLKLKKRIREQDGTICKLNSQLGKHSNSLHQSQEQLSRAMSDLKTREEEISSLKSSVRFAEGSVTLMRYRINKNSSNDSESIITNNADNCIISSDKGSNISKDCNNHTNSVNTSHEAEVKSKIYLNGVATRESIGADKNMEYDFLLSQVHFYWIHHFRKFNSALRYIRGRDMRSNNNDDDGDSSQQAEFLSSNPALNSNYQSDIKSDKGENNSDSKSNDKTNNSHEVFASPLSQRFTPNLNTATIPVGSEEDKNSHNLSPSLSNIEVLMLPNIEKHSPTLLKKLITAWPTSSQPVKGPQWPPLYSPSSELGANPMMALSTSAIIPNRLIAPPPSPPCAVSSSPSIFDRMLQSPSNDDRYSAAPSHHQRLDSMNESFELNINGVTSTTVANAHEVTHVGKLIASSHVAVSSNLFKVQILRLKHENEQAKLEINRFKDMLYKFKSC